MPNLNYALKDQDYTWKNALLWGNFSKHCLQAKNSTNWGSRIIHSLIAAIELIPVISQISSILEKLIVTHSKPIQPDRVRPLESKAANPNITNIGKTLQITNSPLSNIRTIIIKTLTGEDYLLNINPTDTIGQIKARIEPEENIPIDQQRLLFKGKQFEDTQTLQEISSICDTIDLRFYLILRKEEEGNSPSATSPPPKTQALPTLLVGTHRALQDKIFSDAELPPDMIAEDHIISILYDQLIDIKKRTDCVILPPPPSKNGKILENFDVDQLEPTVRYVILPMSVNQNQHNTVLIVDRQNSNKKWVYLDSFSHKKDYQGFLIQKQKQILSECQNVEKPLIGKDYTQDTTFIPSQQSDGWSCGYHAIENAISYISGEKPTTNDGKTLRSKYEPSFNRFVKTHGTTPQTEATRRVEGRKKKQLRFALEELVIIKPKLASLIAALRSDNDRSFEAFVKSYSEDHAGDDTLGVKVLSIVNENRGWMPKSDKEDQRVSDANQAEVKAMIKKDLAMQG